MDLFGYLVDQVIEVVDFHVVATVGGPPSTAVFPEILEHLRLLHELVGESVEVLTPHLYPVLGLPILLFQAK
jgi:hypothetical protein